MNLKFALAATLLLAPAAWARQAKDPKVDGARVEAAVKRGVQYLRTKMGKKGGGTEKVGELVLLTLAHAGIRKGDPLFDELLKETLEEGLETTYRVALQAMILEALDRVAHQERIFKCAQFLIDNQCRNGQWSYGSPTSYPEPTPEPDYGASPGKADAGEKFPVPRKFRVTKQRDGPDHGDNSNSQFAALGLRSCHEAGIILPGEVARKAALSWRENQCGTGGGPAAGVEPRGWNYGPKGNRPYGSMTAGAVGALALWDHLLGIDWKKDDDLNSGIAWMRDNFSVSENPGRNHQHHHYYLYALERACDLMAVARLGKADWYFEGANHLLATQAADGAWRKTVPDTCYALLFLSRATRPLLDPREMDRQK